MKGTPSVAVLAKVALEESFWKKRRMDASISGSVWDFREIWREMGT
jgi:hypothetical protein